MKVCFIGDSTSIHTKRWYNYFLKKGYSIHVISWNKDPGLPHDKIHTLSEKLFFNIKYIRTIFISLWVWRKIKKINPGLIHIQMISRYAFGCLFINHIPVIISIGGFDILKAAELSKIHFLFNKILLKKAAGITTSSKDIKTKLISKYNIPENVIKYFCWGINFELFSKSAGLDETSKKEIKLKYKIPEDNVVFFHNRYFPAAKHKILLESMKKLRYSEFVLLIAKGTTADDKWEEVKEYARDIGIDGKILYIERYLSQEEMAELLSVSDIYLNILTHDQRGLSILEAMASGCIPAVNNLPVYNEFITDGTNGIIFKSEEPEYIADRIYKIIQNLREFKEKCKIFNTEYIGKNDDMEKNESLMNNLYEDVLGENRT